MDSLHSHHPDLIWARIITVSFQHPGSLKFVSVKETDLQENLYCCQLWWCMPMIAVPQRQGDGSLLSSRPARAKAWDSASNQPTNKQTQEKHNCFRRYLPRRVWLVRLEAFVDRKRIVLGSSYVVWISPTVWFLREKISGLEIQTKNHQFHIDTVQKNQAVVPLGFPMRA